MIPLTFFFIRFHQLYWKMGWGLIGRWVEICQTLSHAQRPWLLRHNVCSRLWTWREPRMFSAREESVDKRKHRIKFFLTCIATHTGEWEVGQKKADMIIMPLLESMKTTNIFKLELGKTETG